MSIDWHQKFAHWARPASETEESKAERAARMVREALRAHSVLRDKDFDVVAIGSYRNNTNVRAASDMDLAAVLRSAVWHEFPSNGMPNRELLGIADATYVLADFRRDVNVALREHCGSSDVAPGKIAVTIDDSRARLAADVTPYLLHRRYTGQQLSPGAWQYEEGIETRPANEPNRRIIQWPDQHYNAGVLKNDATGRRYKRVVRILKCLRDELAEKAADSTKATASATRSCFIEHATFNVPNEQFNRSSVYYDDVRATLGYLWHAARDPSRTSKMVEASGLQPLFRVGEPWSAPLLEAFTLAAWNHVGFAQ